jgi:NAD(P)-dependent dehydrogenase (short-subunit alcohol dehydrogenase family)
MSADVKTPRGSVVTGGGGGIGLAVARRLGAWGPVGIVDISQESVDRAVAALAADGVEAQGVVADVADEESATAALRTLGELIRPRVLVTAAGDVDYTDPLQISVAQFERMLRVHVVGTYLAARTLHPYLAAGDGRIVAIGSLAAHQGSPMHMHYAAAKAGIEGLVRSMASAWQRDGIRTNAVIPGTIRTAIFDKVPESVRKGYTAGSRPVGEPDDIAAAVAYLADVEGGRYVNGVSLTVDDGSRLSPRPQDS